MTSSVVHPPGRSFVVGGAVRDALLGRPHGDRDWVVVGATAQQMIDAGFLPVGRDFPVFLHPQTREEYALARTERKTAPGYRGFVVQAAPEVTLEEDLLRRDLTINAMARAADGTLIDPYGGQRDLQARVLRHVSAAFAEDPVRILRLARFAARFGDFSVAPETMDLMRHMVHAGEVDALVPERVWQELVRGLMEPQPQRLFAVLRDCGALARLLPELDRLWGVPQRADYHPEIDTGVHVMLVLQAAVALDAPLAVRWACLMHDLGKGTTPKDVLPRHIGHEQRSVALAAEVAHRLRVPTDCAELAAVVAAEHGNIHRCPGLDAAATLRLLQRCDALRRPERFAQALLACEADHRGRGGDFPQQPYPQRARLLAALDAAQGVDAGAIAQQVTQSGGKATAIAQAVQAAREQAVALRLPPLMAG
ncbi:MAG: multifunctional CCA addition/repair protein [Thiomonas arsenitoxydans]|uniref:Multifunctional CCA protein n=1 Tax=Thiomonas arsenitoxydans (strain DSM 22701 / CIP 110005 / 3As) TaxID=426114 RepID=A0A8I1MVW2_THIA3|nr:MULTISPECIES: multifunctional CCA addition/repair protein [Thiomonas]MBN8744483.1 multifunctional CCA addition/repair protein [Thiomonas arsenitoxydans]ODU97026.1 MAG: multifunctional CCA tRNA nucleotidyl transferase/2'3'-cyclic phosphodiesterase/2'nucleotidase/phosphatase [Thiomonas sp. SCN 64-16]